ncbi:MAG: DUF3119 family protein [Cyanobacteriota bacterium]
MSLPDPAPAPDATPHAPTSSDGALAVVTLEPRYGVPLGVTLLGPLLIPLQGVWGGSRWLILALVLFGGFLLLQTALLRLRFEADALVVLRSDQEIRRFPYADWIGWRLFWPALPVLFYFREQRSPHLLPMLFDAAELKRQLEQRIPAQAPAAPQ